MNTSGQAVFDIDMILNLASVVEWKVVTTANKWQVDIDNVQENSGRVTHEYAIGYPVYVEITGIYWKLDYKKQGPYKTTEVFTNGTIWFQRGKVNEHINLRQLKLQLNE